MQSGPGSSLARGAAGCGSRPSSETLFVVSHTLFYKKNNYCCISNLYEWDGVSRRREVTYRVVADVQGHRAEN